jgi:hypothetical protein
VYAVTSSNIRDPFSGAVGPGNGQQTRKDDIDFLKLFDMFMKLFVNPGNEKYEDPEAVDELAKEEFGSEDFLEKLPEFFAALFGEMKDVKTHPERADTAERTKDIARKFANAPQTFDGPLALVRTSLLKTILKGESGGSYNIVSTFASHPRDAAGNRRDINTMTVGEMQDWQIQQREAGAESSAAGNPQVIYKTLKKLIDSGKIRRDALFNQATQDAISLHLANEQGFDRFLAGDPDMPAEKLADNLSNVWMALKDRTGTNKHDGDGRNRSTTSHSTTVDALNDTRDSLKAQFGGTIRTKDIIANATPPRTAPSDDPAPNAPRPGV